MTTPLIEIVREMREAVEVRELRDGMVASEAILAWANRIEAEARGVVWEYRSKSADSHVWSVWLPLGTRGDWRNFPANTVFEYRTAPTPPAIEPANVSCTSGHDANWPCDICGTPPKPAIEAGDLALSTLIRDYSTQPTAPALTVDDGMLPDALMPVADEWYTLCERRFTVDRIAISGDLARAIVDAISIPRGSK